MNMNIAEALSSIKNKSTPKNNVKEDKTESFYKTFKKTLNKSEVKDRLKDKKGVKEAIQENEESDNLKEYSDISPLIQFYPIDQTLNTENSFDFLGQIVEEANLQIESEISGQEVEFDFNFDFADLGLDSQAQDSKVINDLDLDGKARVENFNLNLEEVKNNLARALGKEDEPVDLEKPVGLEAELSNVKEDIDTKTDQVKPKDIGTDQIEPTKVEKSKNKDDLDFSMVENTEDIENVQAKDEKPSMTDLIPKADEEIESEEMPKEVDVKQTTVEENQNLDANFLINRIQNPILALEEMDEALSTQNIQRVEDSMIKFVKVSKDGDSTVMRVKLYPEELGSIDISLKLDKGKLIADIIVASDKIRDMFLNSSTDLSRNLIEQNVAVKNINITVNDTFSSLENTSGEAQDDQSRGNDGQGQDRGKGTDKNLNNNPIDTMRIDSINKRHIGNKSLDILA